MAPSLVFLILPGKWALPPAPSRHPPDKEAQVLKVTQLHCTPSSRTGKGQGVSFLPGRGSTAQALYDPLTVTFPDTRPELTGTFVPGTAAPSLSLSQTLGEEITPTEQGHSAP